MKIEGLPVIDVDESEKITVAVTADDLLEGDTADPERHPIAIALRRQDDVDDARVTKDETLVRRGKKWFRYDVPDKRLFKELQWTLTALKAMRRGIARSAWSLYLHGKAVGRTIGKDDYDVRAG